MDVQDSWRIGHLAIAIDIKRFLDVDEFFERLDGLRRAIKGSNMAPGFSEILVPGELEERAKRQALTDGIPISGPVLRGLNTYAEEVGLSRL